MLLRFVHIGNFATFVEARFAALNDAFDGLRFLFVSFLRDSRLMALDFVKSCECEVTQFWRFPHSLLLHARHSAASILDLHKLSSQSVNNDANVSRLRSSSCNLLNRKLMITVVRVVVAARARVFFLFGSFCVLHHVSV